MWRKWIVGSSFSVSDSGLETRTRDHHLFLESGSRPSREDLDGRACSEDSSEEQEGIVFPRGLGYLNFALYFGLMGVYLGSFWWHQKEEDALIANIENGVVARGPPGETAPVPGGLLGEA